MVKRGEDRSVERRVRREVERGKRRQNVELLGREREAGGYDEEEDDEREEADTRKSTNCGTRTS